jgi:hypothetical protein
MKDSEKQYEAPAVIRREPLAGYLSPLPSSDSRDST